MAHYDRREADRYLMLDIQDFEGRLDFLNKNFKLVSLGLGGCGFYGDELTEISRPRKVTCEFRWHPQFSKAIRVKGSLIYCVPKNVIDKTIFYYGVEFSNSRSVEPLIEELEEWAEAGKVGRFVK